MLGLEGNDPLELIWLIIFTWKQPFVHVSTEMEDPNNLGSHLSRFLGERGGLLTNIDFVMYCLSG